MPGPRAASGRMKAEMGWGLASKEDGHPPWERPSDVARGPADRGQRAAHGPQLSNTVRAPWGHPLQRSFHFELITCPKDWK